MGLLNKVTRFAKSPEGRRAVNSMTSGGTAAGRRSRTPRRGAPAAGGAGGGMLGRIAGGLLGSRRR